MTIAQRLADAGIEVKPLEWEIACGDEALCHDHWTAAALFGAYHMAPDEDSPGSWLLQWTLRSDDFCMIYGGKITRYGSPDDAKSSARADYTARILSALQEVKP